MASSIFTLQWPSMHTVSYDYTNGHLVTSIQYIKVFVVCPSMCLCVTDVGNAVTNLRVMCKTITCASAFTEMAILFFLEIILYSKSCCRSGYSALQATRKMPLWALAIAHYRRARTQDYLACWTRTRHDFSLTCHSVQRACKAATVATSD